MWVAKDEAARLRPTRRQDHPHADIVFWNLAVGMQRDDLCEFAPFEQACWSISKRDSSMCEIISEEIERSKCYYNTAILTEDKNLCQNLDDEASSACVDHVNFCSGKNYDCTFLAQRYT